MLEQYGMNEFIEGKEFSVDVVVNQWKNYIFRVDVHNLEFFFRGEDKSLLGYLKINVELGSSPVAYIIDTTSASGYKYFSEFTKKVYDENGYSLEKVVPWFWKTVLAYGLAYLKREYPTMRVAPIAAYKENEEAVWDLIARVRASTTGLIQNLSGGSEIHMATIFLR